MCVRERVSVTCARELVRVCARSMWVYVRVCARPRECACFHDGVYGYDACARVCVPVFS